MRIKLLAILAGLIVIVVVCSPLASADDVRLGFPKSAAKNAQLPHALVNRSTGSDTTFAPDPTAPREVPRDFNPFAQVETHRIRIANVADGPVEVSTDHGQTWRQIGRVTAPATESLMGYLASGYAPPGTVAAVAVHGLRIRVGDLNTAYPKLVNILPKEFAQTPVFFGGQVSGASGIYTDIPTGASIFRELSPYSGNPVFRQTANGTLEDLPVNYEPHAGDILTILVKRPAVPITEVLFENKKGGKVTVKYTNGKSEVVTTVLKPVYGVGRYDGTSYTGVGAINTSHTGVLTISTAPVSQSSQFEGTGEERRGGFQIQPSYHNSQSDEAWAPSAMVLGTKSRERQPDLEGTPPLYMGYLNLSWIPSDPDHSWRAEVRYGAATWHPMPTRIGTDPDALIKVTAIRLARGSYGTSGWLISRITADIAAYHIERMALARSGKMPVYRGRVTIEAGGVDPRTKLVQIYIDGVCRGMTNAAPFELPWNTRDNVDGEHTVEIREEDANDTQIAVKTNHVWVDNAGLIKSPQAAKQ